MAEEERTDSGKRRLSEVVEAQPVSFALMEDLLEKLKLVNYETVFYEKNIKPLNRHYFALEMVAAEQFWVFSVLAVWLLQKSKVKIEFPQQLDDPNATVTNIIAGLKKLSIPTDFPPAKLKQGQGEVVCQTLHSLVDHVLKITKFSWKAPVIPKDEYKEEAEADDDAEVTKGSREQLAGNSANNSLHTIQESGKQPEKILDSTIDPTEW
eukprot:Sdes_comp20550_c0_seq2m15280